MPAFKSLHMAHILKKSKKEQKRAPQTVHYQLLAAPLRRNVHSPYVHISMIKNEQKKSTQNNKLSTTLYFAAALSRDASTPCQLGKVLLRTNVGTQIEDIKKAITHSAPQ